MHTIGGNEVLHPRSRDNPLRIGHSKEGVIATCVATPSAAALFPAAQPETRAVAAPSGAEFNAVGRATVVVVRNGDDVVVAPSACVKCRPTVWWKWTTPNRWHSAPRR